MGVSELGLVLSNIHSQVDASESNLGLVSFPRILWHADRSSQVSNHQPSDKQTTSWTTATPVKAAYWAHSVMIEPSGQNLVPVCFYTGWFVCLQLFSIFSLLQYRFTNLLPYFKIKPFSARDSHTLKQTTRCDHVKSSVPSQVCVCALFCFFLFFCNGCYFTPPQRETCTWPLSAVQLDAPTCSSLARSQIQHRRIHMVPHSVAGVDGEQRERRWALCCERETQQVGDTGRSGSLDRKEWQDSRI